MMSLDPLNVLLETFPASQEQAIQEPLRRKFDKRKKAINGWHKQWATDQDPDVTVTQEEAMAAEELARDLSTYREQARNILDGYKDGRFTKEEAIERTNAVLAEMTGLRLLFDTMRSAPLGDILHARLDTRVEVLMEEILTKLVRAVDAKENVTVTFASNGLTL